VVLPDQVACISNRGFVAPCGTRLNLFETTENLGAKRRRKEIGVRFDGLVKTNALGPGSSLGLRSRDFIDCCQELRSQRITFFNMHDRTLLVLTTLYQSGPIRLNQ
jgi:hypothetical protein